MFLRFLDGFVFTILAKVLYISGEAHFMSVRQDIAQCPGHSPHHDLRCGRRKVQLAGRRNTHMSVSVLLFQLPLIWINGAGFYVNIAVSFWFYPGSTYSSTLGRCTADLS